MDSRYNTTIIEQGITLFGLYRMDKKTSDGAMGNVWRVHHTGWNVYLAMKQPKTEKFVSAEQQAVFKRECEAWIELGLHPHIVSCYYVRDINGVPSIFAEWMDDGSLKDQIEDGRLYASDASEKVLDVAIQFARGLHYAHSHKLIHQDVKPGNLMLNTNGEVKVTDFGISRARGGYTPAYCSPEQLLGKQEITRRTDIYSWAVTVLEMYLGERSWIAGPAVELDCDGYLNKKMRVPMPMVRSPGSFSSGESSPEVE